MKIRYLLGGISSDKGFEGDIVNYIKKDIINSKNFVWIASSFENYEKNEKRYINVLEWFKKIGINFLNTFLIDNRISKNEAHEYIMKADVIFLSGGNTLSQINSIKEFDIIKSLQLTNAIIFGISAGAINMCDNVILTKDETEDILNTTIYSGIGITNINVEPHFCIDNNRHNKDLLETSNRYCIFALPNESSIRMEDNKHTYFGYCYKIYKGQIIKI